MDWFLYDRDLRHERVKVILVVLVSSLLTNCITCSIVLIVDFENIFAQGVHT